MLWHNRQNFFVILDCSFPFHHPDDPENQNFEKLKNHMGIHHFTHVYPGIFLSTFLQPVNGCKNETGDNLFMSNFFGFF